ncbi:hypothetical protein ACWERV_00470 [Streptomyces sp. NPDC004031]
MPDLAAARAALRTLEGRPLTAVGRAATLVWFTFGDEVPWADPRGGPSVRELALHLQCRWRLTRGAAVMAEEGDLFRPGTRAGARTGARAGFTAGGEIGTSRFDDRAEAVTRLVAREGPVVDAVSIGEEFDLRLTLSTGMALEVFPAARAGREDWRFLGSAEGGRHYVVENGAVYTV